MFTHKRGWTIIFTGVLIACLFLGIAREVLPGFSSADAAVMLPSPHNNVPTNSAGNLEREYNLSHKATPGERVDSGYPTGIGQIQAGALITPNKGMTITLPLILKSEPVFPPEELAIEQSIARQLNEQRALNGLPELILAPELTQSARKHSRDMADNNFTGHIGSDGTNPGQRIAETGYAALAWGEIIAWGFGGDTSWVVDWWMNSPLHRSLILSSTFTEFGVGYTRDPGSEWGHYWTVNFGLRNSSNDFIFDQEMHEYSFSISGRSGGSSLTAYIADPCP